MSDPYHPQAEYPELLHGAPVDVTHTLGGVTTKLYNGFVLTDPRCGYAGEVARVDVSCGGALEVAKGRSDMGFVFTDADTAQWFANKRSPKCYSFDNSGRVCHHDRRRRQGQARRRRHDRSGRLQRRDPPARRDERLEAHHRDGELGPARPHERGPPLVAGVQGRASTPPTTTSSTSGARTARPRTSRSTTPSAGPAAPATWRSPCGRTRGAAPRRRTSASSSSTTASSTPTWCRSASIRR